MKKPGGAALGIVGLAVLARAAGLGWGLPDETHFFSYHPDEFSVAGTVNGMLNTGDLNPRFFHYGSATIYLTWLLAWPLHAAGFVKTVVGTHVIARLITLAFAAGTVVLVAKLSRALSGERAAWVAASFLALMPGHVLHSAFATVDVPAAFLTTLTLILAVRVAETPSAKSAALAGAAAGLAAATKYNAGIVLLAPVVAVAVGRAGAAGDAGRKLRRAGAACLAALAAFVLATPYAVLDFAAFREDVGFELFEHARSGHGEVFAQTGNGWWYHLTANLPYVAGVPLALAGGAGLVLLARRRSAADLVVLAFASAYFALLGASEVRFLRYLLPLAPVLAVAAAHGTAAVRHGGARRGVLAIVLASLVMLTGRQQAAFAATDPRTAAAEWMQANAPNGAGVGLAKTPWHYTAAITPWNGGDDAYETFAAYEAERGRYRFVVFRGWNVTALERNAPEFFVLSEFEHREEERTGVPAALGFLRELRADYRPAAVFERIPPRERRIFGRSFAPHDWLYPFATVTVWRRVEAAG
ncbi:MAG: ArnT family glycosyltransferase [Candidatus Eiseniibacteriota bacterium]